jgi:hypothetical protein
MGKSVNSRGKMSHSSRARKKAAESSKKDS